MASPPNSFTHDSTVVTATVERITLHGGAGLLISSGGDAVKLVDGSGACTDAPGGGTTEITDLGPDDSADATTVEMDVTFTSSGSFKVCYKTANGNYVQVVVPRA